jgi:serine/threonine protein kinase
LAPEILISSLAKPNISKQDVWSIGVIAYQLCTLRLPFKSERIGATVTSIVNKTHDPISHKLFSNELKDIINGLLNKDPEERTSISDLIKVPIIRDALDNLLKEFEGKIFFELRNSLIEKDFTVKLGDDSLEVYVPEAISKIKEISCAISLIDLPESSDSVSFVYLWGDRLYTEADETLYVYSVGDLISPSATYSLGDRG